MPEKQKDIEKAKRDPANGTIDVAKKLLSEKNGESGDPTIKPLTSLLPCQRACSNYPCGSFCSGGVAPSNRTIFDLCGVSYCRTLFWKVLSNFRRNLTIRHPVNRFNTCDASTEAVFFKTFFEFALSLTRTKYQNKFCITNRRNDGIVVNVEMFRKRSLEAILCRYVVMVHKNP